MPTAPDWRALQVRTEKIIASGSNGPHRILVYSWLADGTPSGEGAINPSVFNTSSIGTDVFFYLSGAVGRRGVDASYGLTLVGGDFMASGAGYFRNGMSGSHTSLFDGTPAFVAGPNVTISFQANGAVAISSSGGGSSSGSQVSFGLTDYGATSNTTSTVVGQYALDGAQYSNNPIYLRGILSAASGTVTASVRLYNATSGAYVHISGTNQYWLTGSGTTPRYVESVNLVSAANFSTTAKHIYELHLSTSNGTYPVYAGGWHFAVYAAGLQGPTGSTGATGGGADENASYVVMGLTSSLPNERVLSASNGISIFDNGAGSSVGIQANLYPKFTVGPSGSNAPYSSISTAIAAAYTSVSGTGRDEVVWVLPSRYVEDVTFYPYVNLCGLIDSKEYSLDDLWGGTQKPAPVLISGSLEFLNMAGYNTLITNIAFVATGSKPVFKDTGSLGSLTYKLRFNRCSLLVQNASSTEAVVKVFNPTASSTFQEVHFDECFIASNARAAISGSGGVYFSIRNSTVYGSSNDSKYGFPVSIYMGSGSSPSTYQGYVDAKNTKLRGVVIVSGSSGELKGRYDNCEWITQQGASVQSILFESTGSIVDLTQPRFQGDFAEIVVANGPGTLRYDSLSDSSFGGGFLSEVANVYFGSNTPTLQPKFFLEGIRVTRNTDATYTIPSGQKVVITTGNTTGTLPTIATAPANYFVDVKNIGSVSVLIKPDGSSLLDAGTTGYTIPGSGSARFFADNTDSTLRTWRTFVPATGSSSGGSGADPAASYVVLAATSSLANERVLSAGPGIAITDGGAGGNVTISASLLAGSNITINQVGNAYAISSSGGSGGSGDPGASYLVLAATASLTNERVLTAGPGITFVDNGANSTLIVSASAPRYQMVAAYSTTTATSSGPQVVGQFQFVPQEHLPSFIRFRFVMSSQTTTASVRVYNLTSGAYVDIAGAASTTIFASNSNPTAYNSVNLYTAQGWSTGSAVYEVRFHSATTTDTATLGSAYLISSGS